VKPHLQNNNGLEQKWPGGAVQAVEHLFFKCKALSSNPFHKKKKKKKEEEEALEEPLITREAGKCSLAVCPRAKEKWFITVLAPVRKLGPCHQNRWQCSELAEGGLVSLSNLLFVPGQGVEGRQPS
jgi:hypothetical protein